MHDFGYPSISDNKALWFTNFVNLSNIALIGASVSEPHTGVFNCNFPLYIYTHVWHVQFLGADNITYILSAPKNCTCRTRRRHVLTYLKRNICAKWAWLRLEIRVESNSCNSRHSYLWFVLAELQQVVWVSVQSFLMMAAAHGSFALVKTLPVIVVLLVILQTCRAQR